MLSDLSGQSKFPGGEHHVFTNLIHIILMIISFLKKSDYTTFESTRAKVLPVIEHHENHADKPTEPLI